MMSEKNSTPSERFLAHQTQEKFNFYLLSLVFTLLALSIQTAKFGDSLLADSLEIVGWLMLLISGVAGLSRMEWDPLIRIKMGQKASFEEDIFDMRKAQLEGKKEVYVVTTGESLSLEKRIENRSDAVKILDPYIAKLEKKHFIKYYLHIYPFVIGITLILCARASIPVGRILQGIGC